MILIPKFTDRAGRTVYDMHQEKENGRYLLPGKFLGQLRMDMDRLDDNNMQFESGEIQTELPNDPRPSWPLKTGEVKRDGTG